MPDWITTSLTRPSASYKFMKEILDVQDLLIINKFNYSKKTDVFSINTSLFFQLPRSSRFCRLPRLNVSFRKNPLG
jgi:hypothetical protein